MSKLEAIYTLEVKDKTGKTVSKVIKPCKSFVLQFLQILEVQIYTTAVTMKDTSGTDRGVPVTLESFDCKTSGGVGQTTTSILVGTGTTPVDNLDFSMESLIAHGVGVGELSYGDTSKVTSAEVGANVDFQLIRTFSNTSGGTINVTEVGIVARGGSYYMLILHEIVTSTPVANGQTLTITITFRTTVQPLHVPWKTLCGTAITMFALYLGYDGYLALAAVGALFGVELYGQRSKKEG